MKTEEKLREFYGKHDTVAPTYGAVTRYAVITRVITSELPPPATILVVGGGSDGTQAGFLREAGYLVTNTDVHPGGKTDVVWDLSAEKIPPEVASVEWDAVVCSEVLEHLWEPFAALARIASLHGPDGQKPLLFVSTPNEIASGDAKILLYLGGPSQHIRHFSPEVHLKLFRLLGAGSVRRIGLSPEIGHRYVRALEVIVSTFGVSIEEAAWVLGRAFTDTLPGVLTWGRPG